MSHKTNSQPGDSPPSPAGDRAPAKRGRWFWLNMSTRLVLPSVLTIALFTFAIFYIVLPALEQNIMQKKREMTREMIQAAWNVLDFYYGQEQSGLLSRDQAQHQAKALLRAQRFGPDHKDYFWINDLVPRMIMHPYRPDLEGEDVTEFTDPQGKRLFSEVVRIVKGAGAGYVDYMWQWKDDPSHIVPKVSYVKEFKPWGWVVGTGIYVQDVGAEIDAMTGRLTTVSLGILILVAVLVFIMVQQGIAAENRRQAAEAGLRSSQGMLKLVMDNIPQLIFWKDKKGAYLGCNEGYAAYAGLDDSTQIKGKDDTDLPLDPKDMGRSREAEGRVMDSAKAQLHVTERRTSPKGQAWWADTNRIPLRGAAGGGVQGVLCTYEDITSRKETGEALAESERRFRALVEYSLVGICIVQGGDIVYMNPEQQRLFGALSLPYGLAQLAKQSIGDFDKLMDLEERVLSGQSGAGDLELRFAGQGDSHPPGQDRYVHCRARRISFQGAAALLIIMMDLTQAKQLEHLVRIQDKMASLGRIAAGIAHEIRNPLSGINMYLSALEDMESAGDAQRRPEVLAKMKSASHKIESVVKRVLDFSRPTAPRLSWVQVNRIIKGVVDLSSVTLRKSRVQVDMSLTSDLPLCYVDAQLIEQVLLNLMTNAVQAMAAQPGPHRLELSSGLQDQFIVMEVADSGPGVDQGIADAVFDPFFTIKKDGSGIGLALSHRIVSDHGGTLTVSPSKFKGAKFTIRLPAIIHQGYDSHG